MCVFRLKPHPQTLAELGESLKLLETLQGDLPRTKALIPLIHDQFAVLDKYDIDVEQDVSTSLMHKHIRIYSQAETWTGLLIFNLYCDCGIFTVYNKH